MARDVFQSAVKDSESMVASVQSPEALREIAAGYEDSDDPAEGQVVAPTSVLKEARDDFAVASRLQMFVDDSQLSLRTSDDVLSSVVSADDVSAVITAGSETVTVDVAGDDEDKIADGVNELFADGEEFNLRSAARDTLLDALEETFSADFRSDYEDAIEVFADFEKVNEVSGLLLLTARHEELLYDISKLGENTNVASKATFSRSKTQLEDAGLLDAEKVPIDVGRPRLRLIFAADALEDADSVEDLFEAAEEML